MNKLMFSFALFFGLFLCQNVNAQSSSLQSTQIKKQAATQVNVNTMSNTIVVTGEQENPKNLLTNGQPSEVNSGTILKENAPVQQQQALQSFSFNGKSFIVDNNVTEVKDVLELQATPIPSDKQ